MQTAMPSATPPAAATAVPLLPTLPAATGPDPAITQAEKSDGAFLVGSEIAAGKWVSRGFKNCIGVLLDKDGNAIDTQMGPEAILFVTDKGYSVKFINPVCKWSYLPE